MQQTSDYFTINYNKKSLILFFKKEKFKWDLTEGDIGEFWHTFTTKKGIVKDINFHQEDETQEPILAVYGLIYDKKDKLYSINMDDETLIKLKNKIGSPKNYFK